MLAQTTTIKENLGPTVNSVEDQILPVFSLDGQTLYFSENGENGRYEIWTSRRDKAGNWQTKQKAEDLNPPTKGSKYVFAQVENDLLLVNGWFEQTSSGLEQSKGLSWFIPSQKRFIKLDIPAIQTQAKGRFVNAFFYRPTKTLFLSYAENERKNLYVCQPEDPAIAWTELRWQKPERLPAPLNSEFDDTTPFLDTDGVTLYFASNRPGGYGEDDIYRSRRIGNSWTSWSPPENLGFGVNSNYSEIYYCISPSRDFQYFVSYKYSYGSGDIFRLRTDSTQRDPNPKDSAEVAETQTPGDSTEVAETPTLNDNSEVTEVSTLSDNETVVEDPLRNDSADVTETAASDDSSEETESPALIDNEEMAEEQVRSDSTEVAETSAGKDTVEVTELDVKQYRPNNLVFLIDRSGFYGALAQAAATQIVLETAHRGTARH